MESVFKDQATDDVHRQDQEDRQRPAKMLDLDQGGAFLRIFSMHTPLVGQSYQPVAR